MTSLSSLHFAYISMTWIPSAINVRTLHTNDIKKNKKLSPLSNWKKAKWPSIPFYHQKIKVTKRFQHTNQPFCSNHLKNTQCEKKNPSSQPSSPSSRFESHVSLQVWIPPKTPTSKPLTKARSWHKPFAPCSRSPMRTQSPGDRLLRPVFRCFSSVKNAKRKRRVKKKHV